MIIKTILKKKLTNNQIKEIINLKKKIWKFSYKSQLSWFKNNVKENDINFLLVHNKKLIGYCLIAEKNTNLHNIKYVYLLDSLIIEKKYSKKNFIFFLKFVKKFIKKKICILVCQKKYFKLYNFFGWKKLEKRKINFVRNKSKISLKSNQFVLTLNIENNILDKLRIFI